MKDIFDLNDRVAIVTGGAGGIGRAICKQLGAFGARIALIDIHQQGMDDAAVELNGIGVEVHTYLCNASMEAEVDATYARVATEMGIPDILINNAAAGIHTPPQDTTLAEWDRVIALSLTGYFLNARAFARLVIPGKKSAAVVNIASIAGSSAIGRGNFAYSVAKGGVIQMTKELAIEWATLGIRVNAIQPCSVNTPGWRAWVASEGEAARKLNEHLLKGIPLGRVAEPEDIASAAHFLASDGAAMITGVILPGDGGNLAFNAGGTLGS